MAALPHGGIPMANHSDFFDDLLLPETFSHFESPSSSLLFSRPLSSTEQPSTDQQFYSSSTLAADTSFPDQQLPFSHTTFASLGLCPRDQSLSSVPPPIPPRYNSTSRSIAITSRRKSKDLDTFLDFCNPTITVVPTVPRKKKFLDNIFRPKSRTLKSTKSSPCLNKQASVSTSALSTFDFGFEKSNSTTQADDTRSICSDDSPDDMGLMRSLTSRVKRADGEEHGSIMRSLTRKRPETPLEHIQSIKIKGRPTISLPTQLISTTNMASYNAPSVEDMRMLSRQQATRSSPLSQEQRPVSPSGSAPSLTDASSVSSRSSHSESVSPTDMSRTDSYFDVQTPASSVESTPCSTPERKRRTSFLAESPMSTSSTSLDAPTIPQRAPSHSKREHVRLARHRSVRSSLRAASMKLETMGTDGMVMAPASVILSRPSSQPFSHELEQLNEAVEEFASSAAARDEEIEQSLATIDEDAAYIASKDLARCSAQEYLADIEDLTAALFAECT